MSCGGVFGDSATDGNVRAGRIEISIVLKEIAAQGYGRRIGVEGPARQRKTATAHGDRGASGEERSIIHRKARDGHRAAGGVDVKDGPAARSGTTRSSRSSRACRPVGRVVPIRRRCRHPVQRRPGVPGHLVHIRIFFVEAFPSSQARPPDEIPPQISLRAGPDVVVVGGRRPGVVEHHAVEGGVRGERVRGDISARRSGASPC